MVYIHGGANIRGAGSDKFIDTSNLVRRSILMNKPIIIVSLNYRVNYLGFGWVKGGNNGLHDLVTGFHWIRKHIAGFGGDPDQITAVGESAGSAAVDALLQGRQERLFRRAVLQSGTVRACLPRSRAEHDAIIQDLCEFCDVDQSRQDWQTKLQVVPVHKLVEKLSSANFEVMPYADDGDFFNAPWQDRSAGWVDSIVVGDCGWESAVHTRWLPLWTATSLIQDFSSSQEHVATLMSTYNLTTDTTDEQAKQIGLDFLNDALFAYPAQAVAQRYRAASVPVYQYVFDQDNPFDPSLKAHHAVDLLFTFRAFDLSNAADATAEDLSTSVQEKWVTYASGESPWNQDTCHAFGPDGQMGPIAPEKLAERRRFAAYDVLSQIPVSELNNVVEHVMRFITCTN